jgi:hypothetical protein
MISVLFVAKNSVYKTLGVDCWDEERDALKWPGGNPIVAHPPCRLWSRWMKHFSKADPSEKGCARFAVKQVRQWGGVLEHPACSTLWDELNLPLPGRSDSDGITIAVEQMWWGHKARKATWLYICGCSDLPPIPFKMGEPECHYSAVRKIRKPNMRRLSHKDRHGTPPEFARWLIAVAEKCRV